VPHVRRRLVTPGIGEPRSSLVISPGWPRHDAQVGRVRTLEIPVAEDYETLNAAQATPGTAFFTAQYRQAQFARHLESAMRILDGGCVPGEGVMRQANPSAHIEGLKMLVAGRPRLCGCLRSGNGRTSGDDRRRKGAVRCSRKGELIQHVRYPALEGSRHPSPE
jgi:hypothetical protein